MKHLLPLLMAGAVILSAPTAHAQEFNDAQKSTINEMIATYIQDHPEKIIEAVENHQREQMVKAQEDQKSALKESMSYFDKPELPVAGNKNGDVRVIEFYDYNCGYCKKAFQDIRVLLESDKNVKVVLIDMPILGPDSLTAAKWALAAKKQDKYFDYHAALMAYTGPKNEEALELLAKNTGLDVAQLKKDLEDPAIIDQIEDNLELARSIGIQGTPGFIIGDDIYRGYVGYDGMKAIIEENRTGGM